MIPKSREVQAKVLIKELSCKNSMDKLKARFIDTNHSNSVRNRLLGNHCLALVHSLLVLSMTTNKVHKNANLGADEIDKLEG